MICRRDTFQSDVSSRRSGKPIGFLFFSSMKTDTYQNAHAEKFVQIALQISIIVQKVRLYQDLKRTILRLRAENL